MSHITRKSIFGVLLLSFKEDMESCMSHCMRKNVLGVSDWVRFNKACPATETN